MDISNFDKSYIVILICNRKTDKSKWNKNNNTNSNILIN